MLFKRFIVFLMAFVSIFTARSGAKYADNYAGHEFPIIAAEQQAPDTTRIMSYNIRCADVNGVDASKRLSIGVRQILEVMPDSLGIQEATPEWMKELDKSLPMYGWVGIERDGGGTPMSGGESCPIFYLNTKFKLADSGNFWLSETPDKPSFGPGAACRRICTWAKLEDRRTGEILVHVNTHYDHVSEEARKAGAEIVIRFIEENFAGLPVVFTADMNTRDGSAAYHTMMTIFSDAGKIAADAVGTGTFHAGSPETHADETIDFVLCSAGIKADAYRVVTKGVDGRFTSDHFPIYADLRIGG